MNRTAVYLLSVLFLTNGLWADRLMAPEEIESLVKQLTDKPRECWIPQGMIRARHMEYHEFDNSMREATETIYRNDSRFRFEIHFEDGLSLDNPLGQKPPQQFQQDFKLNRDRIFIWDGQKHIQYYQSADYATVDTGSPATSTGSYGPMSAGIVPWGQGYFSFSVIMSQNPTASVFQEDGRDKIRLQYVNHKIILETLISLVFDPSKDDVLLSFSIENDEALLRQTYEDYTQAGDQWVPSKILIERFDKRSGTPQLISYEDWQFETVDTAMPSNEVFSVKFRNGTMVELSAGGNLKTFIYNASDQVDISKILEDKVALLQAPDPDSVNCATAAIQHIAKRFSKNILPPQLAGVVSADTKKTALSAMKKVLEEAGLNCMAVETDLETLEKMTGCTKVLYLSLGNHYVILDHIDEDGIWLIDLTSRKFYTKINVDEFLQEWNHGIAMLVSNEPITPPLDANFRYLQADEMSRIYGGDSFGKYSCTDLIQGDYHVNCPDPIGGIICAGAYYKFKKRFGCIEDETGGFCAGGRWPGYEYSHCVFAGFADDGTLLCNLSANPATRFIRACN